MCPIPKPLSFGSWHSMHSWWVIWSTSYLCTKPDIWHRLCCCCQEDSCMHASWYCAAPLSCSLVEICEIWLIDWFFPNCNTIYCTMAVPIPIPYPSVIQLVHMTDGVQPYSVVCTAHGLLIILLFLSFTFKCSLWTVPSWHCLHPLEFCKCGSPMVSGWAGLTAIWRP